AMRLVRTRAFHPISPPPARSASRCTRAPLRPAGPGVGVALATAATCTCTEAPEQRQQRMGRPTYRGWASACAVRAGGTVRCPASRAIAPGMVLALRHADPEEVMPWIDDPTPPDVAA